MADAVEEAPWCRACRRSSELKWKRHVFTKKHQAAALRFLRARVAELAQFCDAPPSAWTDWREGEGGGGDKSLWRCRFCEGGDAASAKPTSEERRDRRAGVDHFASREHRRSVEHFCIHHRCDHERQIRTQLWLAPERQCQLVAALEKQEAAVAARLSEAERTEADAQRAWKAEAFLSSAVARLQEVQTAQQAIGSASTVAEATAEEPEPRRSASTLGPLSTIPASRLKTIASKDGVLQNPLGRHNGERVWGGGIVKLKGIDKIPWGIDFLVKEEQARRAGTSTTSSVPDGGGANEVFTHRITDMAYGGGLSTIARVDWAMHVGNVHTGAVPPWMVDSEDDYKRRNSFQIPRSDAAAAAVRGSKERRGNQSSHDPNWLPNFGSVWESGPRSRTKLAFQKAARLERKAAVSRLAHRRADAVKPAGISEAMTAPPHSRCLGVDMGEANGFAPATASDDAVGVSARPDTIAMSQPQALPTPPASLAAAPAPPSQATPPDLAMQPPPPSEPSIAALDSRKQQLLAQKERLRAKFAARRQR